MNSNVTFILDQIAATNTNLQNNYSPTTITGQTAAAVGTLQLQRTSDYALLLSHSTSLDTHSKQIASAFENLNSHLLRIVALQTAVNANTTNITTNTNAITTIQGAVGSTNIATLSTDV